MKQTALLVAILVGLQAWVLSLAGHGTGEQVKHHHELRGRIAKVEPAKNEFTIETDQGHQVLCVIDAKTVLKRDNKTIKLDDVRPGERARCHCAAIKDGKHYSQQLLLEKEKH